MRRSTRVGRSRWRAGDTDISAEPKGRIAPRDLRNPFVLLATGLGSGLSPFAPGTVGSALALPIWWFAFADLAPLRQLAVVAALAATAIWVVDRACRAARVGDASAIVLDEFVGQWIALLCAPKSWAALGAAFILFRAFDIAKPWPASWIDRSLRGGLGVVLDDVVAGVLAALVLQLSVGLFHLQN